MMSSNTVSFSNGFLFSIFILSALNAVEVFAKPKLLDANRVPLTALTAPGRFYFLEFPVKENGSELNPICADGSPYSFAFRRGTDEHASKFIIEFEGGPACWDDHPGSACCDSFGGKRHVPWHDYMTYFREQVVMQKTLPELGTCKGIPSGFLAEGAEFVFSDDSAINKMTGGDLPIPLRDSEGESWWQKLGGDHSDIRDWSYILLPHCSMDWHLGHQQVPKMITGCGEGDETSLNAVYHRGGTNVDAVTKWIKRQFPSGLDALVTTSGGKLGGCSNEWGPSAISSIGPALLAANLATSTTDETTSSPSSNSKLVIMEGSGMWDPRLPTPEVMSNRWNTIDLSSGGGIPETMETLIQSSTDETQFMWMSSSQGEASDQETLWFIKQNNDHGDKFHLYEPEKAEFDWCPAYALPGSEPGVTQFFSDVIKSMSWSSAPSNPSESKIPKLSLSSSIQLYDDNEEDETRTRLTFLTIFIIVSIVAALAWVIYFIIKRKNARVGKKAPLSPSDLWFIALTEYPIAFFIVSLIIPITLSLLAFAQNDVRVNMDFDSYLQVDTALENVKRNFNEAQQNQKASLDIEEANCNLFGRSIFSIRKLSDENAFDDPIDEGASLTEDTMFGNREILDEMGLDVEIDQKIPLDALSPYHRELSLNNLNYFSGGEWISIMYQNRKGGNVFEPDVLEAIHEFESSMYNFPGFQEHCYGLGPNRCLPIDSLITRFFRNGELVGNTEPILRSFLTDRPALWKLDQYFGPDNLGSNVTRSFVFLKNMGGDQSGAHPFLKSFYRDFLVKHDRKRTYPEFVHTWNNYIMKTTEADDALLHDTLWSIGSLIFVSLMILLKVRSVFVVFFSMLGLVLAFSVSFYWVSAHFLISNITLIWVAGLFVMLGIGADDIFLMVDSFEHTKYEFQPTEIDGTTAIHRGDNHDHNAMDVKLEILQKRMRVAYRKAGSMMLVSSVTTAICFFSNGFGVLTVIQEFGIFMGMVVLVNYLHVMTILPSSILVNELYVADLQDAFVAWCKSKCCRSKANLEQDGDYSTTVDAEKCSLDEDGNNVEPNAIVAKTSELNRTDRYLVENYAPFVTRRPYYMLGAAVLLAIVLGISGAFTFAVNDGSIVLFSSRYNLGRLETVTDRYYNDDEDVYTTIEKDTGPATFAPTSPPVPVMPPTTSGPTLDPKNTFGGSITFLDPEEATAQGLPGAITPEQAEEMFSSGVDQDEIGGSDFENTDSNSENTDSNYSENTDSNNSENTDSYSGNTDSFADISISNPDGDTPPADSVVAMPPSGNSGGGPPPADSGGGGVVAMTPSDGGMTASNAEAVTSGSGSNGNSNDYKGGAVESAPVDMRRRETIHVKLIWGVASERTDSSLWVTKRIKQSNGQGNYFDLADPQTQAWLLESVEMAKNKPQLFVRQDKTTWIEQLRDFAAYAGVEFPIPRNLFIAYVELLKLKDDDFRDAIDAGIGTTAPGLAGKFTYASITMMVDSVEVSNSAAAAGRSMSEDIYNEWTNFTAEANALSPSENGPPVVAQSSIFLDAYRVEALYDSTLTTWFVANGVCLLVILLFLQNVALSFMVMVTITLILLCLGGLLFAIYRIPFGPVEALGVSIFIGLSANYSLHVVHAYHHSKSINREEKITEAIFSVGSPIVASALSTMGASAFLFACRTWVFIELGILICSITGMALVYTMTFLIAWLFLAGPLPVEANDTSDNPSHRWDLRALFLDPCWKKKKMTTKTPNPALEGIHIPHQPPSPGDEGSVYSIEVSSDDDEDNENEVDSDDDGDDYSIEVTDDEEEGNSNPLPSVNEEGSSSETANAETGKEGDNDCPLVYHLNDKVSVVQRTA